MCWRPLNGWSAPNSSGLQGLCFCWFCTGSACGWDNQPTIKQLTQHTEYLMYFSVTVKIGSHSYFGRANINYNDPSRWKYHVASACASSHMPKSTVKKQLHKLKKKLNADLHIKTQAPPHELHFPTYSISIFHQFSSVYPILSFSWIKLLYPNFRSLPWVGFFTK